MMRGFVASGRVVRGCSSISGTSTTSLPALRVRRSYGSSRSTRASVRRSILYLYPLKFMYRGCSGSFLHSDLRRREFRCDGQTRRPLMTIYSVSIIAVFALLGLMYRTPIAAEAVLASMRRSVAARQSLKPRDWIVPTSFDGSREHRRAVVGAVAGSATRCSGRHSGERNHPGTESRGARGDRGRNLEGRNGNRNGEKGESPSNHLFVPAVGHQHRNLGSCCSQFPVPGFPFVMDTLLKRRELRLSPPAKDSRILRDRPTHARARHRREHASSASSTRVCSDRFRIATLRPRRRRHYPALNNLGPAHRPGVPRPARTRSRSSTAYSCSPAGGRRSPAPVVSPSDFGHAGAGLIFRHTRRHSNRRARCSRRRKTSPGRTESSS